MPARILVVGLDGCDAGLVDRWSAEGFLPGFAHLIPRARALRLASCMDTLPGAIWPELTMGRSSGKVAQFCHPAQLRTGESRLRPLEPFEVDPESYYWTVAARHGRRVAAIDQVQTVLAKDIDGVQLAEWGPEARVFPPASEPAELLEEIDRRFGRHPVRGYEHHRGTPRYHAQLLRDLAHGIETRTRFSEELLARERWDLFACTFAESHCVGHRFWHFQDPSHPRFRRDAPEVFRHAMRTTYAALDGALSRLVAGAGADTTVFVVASHGMGPRGLGPLLLPELLVRLGLATGGRSGAARLARRALDVVRLFPSPVREALKHVASTTGVGTAVELTGFALDPFASPRTVAAVLPNNRVGAIRLNMRGREPMGCVAPGEHARELLARLRRELMALRHPVAGQPIVDRVVTADEAFGPGHHPDLPDLMVVFRRDLGPLPSCVSPTVGTIRVPAAWRRQHRTGDHTPESRLWVLGPGIEPGTGAANVLDLAPTVLARLDVPLPAWLDGHPVTL